MAVREALRESLGQEPAAIVVDDELDVAGRSGQADGDAVGVCVLDDVGEQLTCRREDELVVGMALVRGKVEPKLRPARPEAC